MPILFLICPLILFGFFKSIVQFLWRHVRSTHEGPSVVQTSVHMWFTPLNSSHDPFTSPWVTVFQKSSDVAGGFNYTICMTCPSANSWEIHRDQAYRRRPSSYLRSNYRQCDSNRNRQNDHYGNDFRGDNLPTDWNLQVKNTDTE
jgi:hypothetical protein